MCYHYIILFIIVLLYQSVMAYTHPLPLQRKDNSFMSVILTVAPEKMLPIDDMTEDMRVHHMLSTEGVKACHRVLYVISETHPQIQQVR